MDWLEPGEKAPAFTLKDDQGKEVVIPLNTPDGRPIFMNPDNAIAEGSVNH